LRNAGKLQCTDVVPGVIRLTSQQRAWAREYFGVGLPRVMRSDDPSSRLVSNEMWRIAIAARYQSNRELENAWSGIDRGPKQ
jgi:hypothetical protein